MRHRTLASVTATALLLAGTLAFGAGVPTPTGKTSTLYGGERLEPKTIVLGASTGYPKTTFDAYFGLTRIFDLGIHFGITYGARLAGIRQRVGMDFHLPLRFTVIQQRSLSAGVRLAPYFMVGEGSPSISTGGDIAFLFDIALPKLFKIIVGPEVRTGFASVGDRNRIRGYDGGGWVNIGAETLLIDRIHLGWIFHGGAQWGRLGVDGVFRAVLYVGVRL